MRWILALWITAGTAFAQEESMELQRCIWRCLSGSPGAASAQYNQCVQKQCMASQAAPATTWQTGTTQDGARIFAGLEAPGGGMGFYYICSRAGESFFILTGLDGPDAQMRFVINGVLYLVPFAWVADDFRIDLAPGSAFMNAIASAAQMEVRNSSDLPLMTLPLANAGGSMQAAVNACFG